MTSSAAPIARTYRCGGRWRPSTATPCSTSARARGAWLWISRRPGIASRRWTEIPSFSSRSTVAWQKTRGSREICHTVVADARDFDLGGERFPLIIVPMQTIQLLGGPEGRGAFLRSAHRHVTPGGVLAIAIAEVLEPYEVIDGWPAPLPDVREIDGVVYSSQPIAVRADDGGFVLERRRETVSPAGARTVAQDLIRLDGVNVEDLEREGSAAGFTPAGRDQVAETADYSGSEVVILRA